MPLIFLLLVYWRGIRLGGGGQNVKGKSRPLIENSNYRCLGVRLLVPEN